MELVYAERVHHRHHRTPAHTGWVRNEGLWLKVKICSETIYIHTSLSLAYISLTPNYQPRTDPQIKQYNPPPPQKKTRWIDHSITEHSTYSTSKWDTIHKIYMYPDLGSSKLFFTLKKTRLPWKPTSSVMVSKKRNKYLVKKAMPFEYSAKIKAVWRLPSCKLVWKY